MKRLMILPVYFKRCVVHACNARMYPSGMRSGRGACFIKAAVVSVLMTGATCADTHYVNAARPDDSGSGLSWATAAKSIQAAVNAATDGDMIVVTNGTYASISTTNKSIVIQSVNGQAVTIIDGGRATRCATLGSSSSHTNTVLVGFTLRNGLASNGAGSYYGTLSNCTLTANSASYGGGSYEGTLNNCTLTWNSAFYSGGGSYNGTLNNCTFSKNSSESEGGGSCYGTLNNCMLSSNNATFYGGGSYGSTLSNCTLSVNSASTGGGAAYSTLTSCLLSGNSAGAFGGGSANGTLNNCTLTANTATSGGGSYYGTLNNCTLSGNRSSTNGGGSTSGTLNNCMFVGNRATSSGGGSSSSTLNNCTLLGNTAVSGGGTYASTLHNCKLLGNSSTNGGGTYDSTLINCTLTSNRASSSGGGSYIGTLQNCIVWGNTLSTGATNNYSGSTFRYSCTTPLPAGTKNISDNPLFKDTFNTNFMLRAASPCINAGTNGIVVVMTDLAGNPRIQNGTVDMGAYEMPAVTVTFDARGGLLAAGQASTNVVVLVGDVYGSWLTFSNGISRVGYTFGGWRTATNGTVVSITSNSVISIATNHTIYANWAPNTYTLSILNARGDADPANGDHPYLYGDAVVARVPEVVTDGNTRYVCEGASVNGNAFTLTASTNVTLTVTNHSVLSWQWSTNYFLSLTATNGLILDTAQGWKPANSNYQLSVQAAPGYTFDHWELDGLPVGAGVPLSLSMDQAHSVVAVFRSLFMDVSANVYWNATWVFNPRKGYFVGTLTITNTNAFKVLTAPFWFQVENTEFHWLRYPTGVNPSTGIQYLDITTSVTNQLKGIGNGDLALDLGESVTVTGIELMGRRTPDGVVVAVWADPPGMCAKPVDSDGDGMSDVDEYITGTSAVDPDSVFRIRLGADGRSVQWEGKPNRVYTVMTSTNLSHGFVVEQDNITSTGNTMTHTPAQRGPQPDTAGTRFFRVNVNLK